MKELSILATINRPVWLELLWIVPMKETAPMTPNHVTLMHHWPDFKTREATLAAVGPTTRLSIPARLASSGGSNLHLRGQPGLEHLCLLLFRNMPSAKTCASAFTVAQKIEIEVLGFDTIIGSVTSSLSSEPSSDEDPRGPAYVPQSDPVSDIHRQFGRYPRDSESYPSATTHGEFLMMSMTSIGRKQQHS